MATDKMDLDPFQGQQQGSNGQSWVEVMAPAASTDCDFRDPAIVKFEQSLIDGLENLLKQRKNGKQEDFVTVDEHGVYLYNANQCASIIEGCKDKVERNNTRIKVESGLNKIAQADGGWSQETTPRYFQIDGFQKGVSVCL